MKTLFFSLVGVAALGVPVVHAGAGAFDQFSVQKANGSACEIAPKGAAWKPAKEGDVYQSGTKGRTGSESTLVVAFDEKNRFRLFPRTEVEIRTDTRDPRYRKVIDLAMKRGNVGVDLDDFPKGYQMKVQTPTAVCGAVGTRFMVQSAGGQENLFTCAAGSIFAGSLEDDSFHAPKIAAGQTLKADAAPGQDNTYTRLSTGEKGGSIPIAVGSKSNTLEVEENSTIQLAQQHVEDTKQVAVKVDDGKVNGNGQGRYVVNGGALENLSDDSKGAGLVDRYVDLAQSEGKIGTELRQAKAQGESKSEIDRIQNRLDRAAEEATEARKELFEYRRVIRDTIRRGANLSTGGGRPTTSPVTVRPPSTR